MNPIGGELEAKNIEYNIFFTDSGRSSLRLFIKNNQNKTFLIPNLLCSVIEDILIQENISYKFYNIHRDLSLDINSIINQEYDVLYIINYFGIIQNTNKLNLQNKMIIEDNVFFDDFVNNHDYTKWFGFNSYRKISSLSDGSMIKTNLSINPKFIINKDADFISYKHIAKVQKFDFKHKNIGTEKDYLEIFFKGEDILNSQEKIYTMSAKAIYNLKYINIYNNQKIAKNRFDYICSSLEKNIINFNPIYYSFAILNIKNRDIIQNKLRDKNIFLPIHWHCNNDLSKDILSIPLFSNYSDEEFQYMIDSIKELLC